MRGLALAVVLGGCDAIFGLHDVSLPPDAPPPPGAWSQVAAGNTFTCAIDLDGGLWCWGYNGNGETGTNVSISELDVPTRVTGGPWSAIAAGSAHACGLHRADQSLWCWGSNFSGQLGNPGPSTIRAPQQVAGQWTAIAVRGDHTCALDASSQLWCWGQNSLGQVGDGSINNSYDQPQKIAIAMAVKTMALGRSHTCVLTSDQRVTCWGANFSGQLGIGAANASPSPAPGNPVDGTWNALAAGDDFTCAIDPAKAVHCWGENSSNQLGDGGDVNAPAPHPIATDDHDFTMIAGGSTQACAVHSDGTLACWGDATPGILALPSTTPLTVSGGANRWTALSLGRTHGCGLGKYNDLYCSGDGSSGELGNGSADTFPSSAPIQVELTNVTDVGAGGNSTCALLSNKHIWCWGQNAQSQLGDGTVTRRFVPTPVTSATEWADVSVGATHACATSSGTNHIAYCWGYRGLGNAPSVVPTPAPVTGNAAVMQLTAGGDHTCAITSDGAQCWGSNPYGDLGIGTSGPTEVIAPTPTKPLSSFAAITAGGAFTCAISLAAQSVLYCAGSDDHHQLGLGATTGSAMFESNPAGGTGWTSVAAGYQHACAIKANIASCWGLNNFGQATAPPGGTIASPTPVQGTWDEVAPGKYHTCGIRMLDKQIGCWGRNDFGQLGDRTRSDAAVALAALPAAIFTKIVSGDNHSCALTDQGALWCWGNNHEGQLGSTTGWSRDFVNVPDPR
jgi:alpha-tubulin suppressor-like RCC1 family protein